MKIQPSKEALEAIEQYYKDKRTTKTRTVTLEGGPLDGTTRQEEDLTAAIMIPLNSRGEPATKKDVVITTYLYSRNGDSTIFLYKSKDTHKRKKGGLFII